jgi:hypothetical protein
MRKSAFVLVCLRRASSEHCWERARGLIVLAQTKTRSCSDYSSKLLVLSSYSFSPYRFLSIDTMFSYIWSFVFLGLVLCVLGEGLGKVR